VKRHIEVTSLSAKTLIPLGALAVVAGCGGGGGGTSALPPHSSAPNAPSAPQTTNGATVRTMLTIAIPARGPAAKGRKPLYISQGSAAIGVSVGTTGGTQPTETVFPLPTPAPQATSTTVPVVAPIGNDTVKVNVYDAIPTATSSPHVLSQGTTVATVTTGTTGLSVQALGYAAGVQITSGLASAATVFQNHGVAQNVPLTVSPIDAAGYTITGALANPIALTVPVGVSISPATVSAGGSYVASYAAKASTAGGTISAGLPLDIAANSTDNFTLATTQYAYAVARTASGMNVYAIDPIADRVVSFVSLPANPGSIAFAPVAGCASGEDVIVSAYGARTTTDITFPVPISSAVPAMVDVTSTILPVSTVSGLHGSLAADPACGLYSIIDAAAGNLTRCSGFPAPTSATLTPSGFAPKTALGVSGSSVYGTTLTSGSSTTAESFVSVAASGGAATAPATVYSLPSFTITGDSGITVGGTNVYVVSTSCGSGYQAANLATGTHLTAASQYSDGVGSPNGTIYLFQNTPSTQTSPLVSVLGQTGAVSADGRFLCAVNANAVQVYSVPATQGAAPVAIGTPLTLAGATSTYAIEFPK